MFKKKTLAKLVGSVVVVGGLYISSPYLSKEHSKILPSEQGGLPTPFMTELVDDDRDGTPDRTLLHSVGPMFYNGQEREPTKEEIDWYKSQD